MQALRTRPCHLVLLIGLPRNNSRNCSRVRLASLNKSGRNRVCSYAESLTVANARDWTSASSVLGDFRFHGQTSWQISQPQTCRPIGSRNSSGIVPRSSIVKYAMQRLASSTYGSTIACVGHASRQRRQVPQRSGGGGSTGPRVGAKGRLVNNTPRKSQEPNDWLISNVFFASHPSPAYFAAARSCTGPVSA